jgi:hypothetical protein
MARRAALCCCRPAMIYSKNMYVQPIGYCFYPDPSTSHHSKSEPLNSSINVTALATNVSTSLFSSYSLLDATVVFPERRLGKRTVLLQVAFMHIGLGGSQELRKREAAGADASASGPFGVHGRHLWPWKEHKKGRTKAGQREEQECASKRAQTAYRRWRGHLVRVGWHVSAVHWFPILRALLWE